MGARTALDRHLALVGFMGAGKTTLGPRLAGRLGREFLSIDAVVAERTGSAVADLFETHGEAHFRQLEEAAARDVLSRRPAAVIELGGGALGADGTRSALAEHAFVLHLETTSDEAWERVAGSDRPLAQDPDAFRRLFEERRPLYEDADGRARDLDGAVLAAGGVRFGSHREARGEALVADASVAELHHLEATHRLPAGEEAKTFAEVERLARALSLDRSSTLVAVGGGTTTDAAGFVAATYMRGIDWIAVPSTLVGQVDAAIGGKVAIDLPEGKNLLGAFHWPVGTVIDTALLETLPADEHANGLAEVVKTGLLAGKPFWELPLDDQVRACAAFKTAVCLRDPYDRGARAQLNLGHTFAHALEASSDFALPHGRAVALGLLAALRLSGLDHEVALVTEVLDPHPVAVDADKAWAALQRDKKAVGGQVRLVLLDAPGKPRTGVEVEPASVRAALDELIA